MLMLIFVMYGIHTSYAQKKYKVVLDAGHGGKDPGNLGNGYRESKIVLKVALLIGKELEKNNKDIEVVYTRNKDVFVELHNRAKIANEGKADLFVSVHCDSYRSPKAFGAGTFVLGLSGNKQNLEIAKRENAVILMEDNYEKNYDYDPNSPESVISLSMLQEENLDESLAFAELVQNNFSLAKRYDRSVKQNNFLVLRETVMPSVLIELGFLTNKAEGKFLNSSVGQLKMAKSIAKAIGKYINQQKLNTVDNKVVTSDKKQNTITGKKETSTTTVAKKEKKVPAVKKEVKPKSTPPVKKKETVVSTEKIKKKEPTKNLTEKKPAKIDKQEPVLTIVPQEVIIEFKVQIAASREYLTDENFNFRGLEDVEVLVIDEYFKYYYGSSTSFTQAKKNLKVAKNAGHKGCFIVAFENGQKISIQQALRKR
ncbi:N-acetylmuramoyl-L-alanine amidase [uncultured Tenacibaculum sp.]|uniref:N-acetylmuramoyl-L-alanine amidase n=2 Tax=Tenacibaculum TaxID=104267 RepID=UPI00260FA45F|nr:N-acetylmuramoyl-L-alanine amidase [uncultured Tenacibaculum sp.]